MMGNFSKIWHNASRSSLPIQLFVVLLLLCAYQLASATWYWLSPPWLTTPYVPYQTTENSVSQQKIDVESVMRYQLFGAAQQQSVVKVDAPIKAPETKLRLELRGVVASGDAFGAAIIADDAKVESYYRVGDQLPGNALLHEVYSDKVILDRGGKYETLSLPVERIASRGGAATANNANGVRRDSPQIQADLIKYRKMLQTNPQQLMGLMRATPVNRGGRQVGYRIAPGRDRSLLGKFGLRPGDIVTSINGIALNSPANGLSVMQNLNSAQSLSVEIERNGGKQSLQFSLN